MNRDELGEKEFFKSYIVLLREELTCTINSSMSGPAAGASKVAAWRANVWFQKFFFPWFCLHLKSKIYFFPETYNALTISELYFTVCYSK